MNPGNCPDNRQGCVPICDNRHTLEVLYLPVLLVGYFIFLNGFSFSFFFFSKCRENQIMSGSNF
jgi:hypothetical protein